MRALWVTTFPPRHCGIGDYAFDLVSHLASDKALELRVVTYPDGVATEVIPSDVVAIRRILSTRPSRADLARAVSEFSPDVVHLQSSTFLHPPPVNRAVRKADGAPLITTVHDTPRSWRVFYTIPSLRGVYRASSRLVVHSARVGDVLQRFHHIPSEKILRIPHGVDTRRYRPDAERPETRATFGLERKRVVLFFGFLRPGKGLETLLRAWSKVGPAVPDAVLVLAGGSPTGARRYGLLHDEGTYPQELSVLARTLNVDRQTIFTGYVPDAQVPGLLAAAEVIVLPYDANEAQSGPFHKALSTGRAVVATAVPGFRDVVTSGEQAILVPPKDEHALGDAIQELLEDPTRARGLGHAARQLAERTLDFSVVAQIIKRLYVEVADNRAKAG